MEQSRGSKKRMSKVDRISALPDRLLHHILSFLPSTKEAIRTGILSKRWRNQWTRVPVLIFDSLVLYDSQDFITFIDSALLQLNQCSKIKKFHLGYNFKLDPNFSSKIRFAMSRHVEELILNFYYNGAYSPYQLPKFLFDNASLVKLEMSHCYFMDDWTINWGSLEVFKMAGYTTNSLVANVLHGCPSLESLHLHNYNRLDAYTIVSTSLKILSLQGLNIRDASLVKISCPNLEELSIKSWWNEYGVWPNTVIENVVIACPFLRSLELVRYRFQQELVIASKSLKKLVLSIGTDCEVEILCPNLEEFNFYNSHKVRFNLMNNFDISQYGGCQEDKVQRIFEQLRSVDELTIESWFIKILSNVEMQGRSYQWLYNKILTLVGPNFEHLGGILCALRSSPALERLVIKLQVYECQLDAEVLDLSDSRENEWNSNGTIVNCLLSHLKIVEIVGLSKQDAKCKSVLNFIGFLLKNARVLEKLVLVISKDGGKDFAFEVSQKVSSFTRCSQHAAVELLCS